MIEVFHRSIEKEIARFVVFVMICPRACFRDFRAPIINVNPKIRYFKSQPSKTCLSPSFYYRKSYNMRLPACCIKSSHWKGFEIQTLNIGFCLGTDERNNDNADR